MYNRFIVFRARPPRNYIQPPRAIFLFPRSFQIETSAERERDAHIVAARPVDPNFPELLIYITYSRSRTLHKLAPEHTHTHTRVCVSMCARVLIIELHCQTCGGAAVCIGWKIIVVCGNVWMINVFFLFRIRIIAVI